jgi:hypothetical protein
MSLSSPGRHLLNISASVLRTDPVLQTLLRATDLTSVSFGLAITLLTNGYLVRGNLMGARAYAEELEAALDIATHEAAERYASDDRRRATVEAWRNAVLGSFSRQVEDLDAADAAHMEKIEEIAKELGVSMAEMDRDGLPADVAEIDEWLQGPRSVLTLENAELIAPPAFQPQQIGVMRVHTAQIAAWWLTPTVLSSET